MLKYFRNLFFVCLIASFPAHANMVLNKALLFFDAGSSNREDIEIVNQGDDTLYIDVTAYEISNPETAKPIYKEITDPRSAGLIVSPPKLILAPQQRKIVRVIATQPAVDKDKVYRVKFMPKAPEVIATKDGADKTKQAGVKVLIGYEILAFVRPPNPHADLKVTRTGKTATFTNSGNTNLELRQVKVCNAEKTDCTEINGKRLYAGQTWSTDLPRVDGVIVVHKSVNMEFSEQEF